MAVARCIPSARYSQTFAPGFYTVIENKFYIDEIYEATIIRFNAWFARFCDAMDFWVWNGAVQLLVVVTVALSWTSRFCDELVVNLGFDQSCKGLSLGGKIMSRLQDGRIQNYLRVIGIALTALALLLIWGVAHHERIAHSSRF